MKAGGAGDELNGVGANHVAGHVGDGNVVPVLGGHLRDGEVIGVRLRDLAEELEPSLKVVWPRNTRFEKRCYALLRDAYVKARYSRSYRISDEQLAWIAERVTLLQSLVREACETRIETLAKAA